MEITREKIKVTLNEEERKAVAVTYGIITKVKQTMKENQYDYFRTNTSCVNLQCINSVQSELERMVIADGNFEIEK